MHPFPKSRKRLPTVLSLEEVTRLIDAACNLDHGTLLMTLYSTAAPGRICRLKVQDIDSQRMMIRSDMFPDWNCAATWRARQNPVVLHSIPQPLCPPPQLLRGSISLLFAKRLFQPQLEAKGQRKLRRLTQRLLNIDHELDSPLPKMSAHWPVNERNGDEFREAEIEHDFQEKCRKGAKFAAHTAFSAMLGEISCLFSLALESFTRFRGGSFQPLTQLSGTTAVSSQASALSEKQLLTTSG